MVIGEQEKLPVQHGECNRWREADVFSAAVRAAIPQRMACLALEAVAAVRGQSDGAHGVLLAYGIQAVSLGNSNARNGKGSPDNEAATMVEGLFRVLNNMSQRFNQCYYFYIFASTGQGGLRFVPLEVYIVPVVLMIAAMLLGGAALWARAGQNPKLSADAAAATPAYTPWDVRERATGTALAVVIGVYGLTLLGIELLPIVLPELHTYVSQAMVAGCKPGAARTLSVSICSQKSADVTLGLGVACHTVVYVLAVFLVRSFPYLLHL